MKRFDIIEHTADTGIVAYGADLREAFANAAYAMFTLIANPEDVSERTCREIQVQAENQEDLLVSWLNEFLYLFDTEGIIFKRFEISEIDETSLKAKCFGEPLDPERHSPGVGVKAATYHMLRVTEDNEGYSARVIFDV